jgi:hypothetical protein
VHISAKVCPECGFTFEIIDKPKHAATAAVLPILKAERDTPQRFPIKTRKFSKHINKDGNESVRVDFYSGSSITRCGFRSLECARHGEQVLERSRRQGTGTGRC